MMRTPFRPACDAPAFAAGLRAGRAGMASAPPVPRIVRALARPLLQRIGVVLSFALRVIARAAAPCTSRTATVTAPAQPAAGALRERFTLALRILERSERVRERTARSITVAVTSPAPPAPASAPRSSPAAVFGQVERHVFYPRMSPALARSVATRTEPRPAVAQPASHPPAPVRESTAMPALASRIAAAATLPSAELARVTEHVIRELDHRVLSYRERTGRT